MGETALAEIATGLADTLEGTTSSGLELMAKDENPDSAQNPHNNNSLDATVAYAIALSTYAVEVAAEEFGDAYKTAQKMKDIFYGAPVIDREMIRKVEIISEYARKRAAIPTSRTSLVPDGSSPKDMVRLDRLSDHAHAIMHIESERLFGTPDINSGSARMRSFVMYLADGKFTHAESVLNSCDFDPVFREYLKAEIHRNYHPSGLEDFP